MCEVQCQVQWVVGYNERMLQRTVFINKNQDATTNAEEYYRPT